MQIGAEQAAEEHDFSSEKGPHAKTDRVALLLRFGKMMQQGRIMGRVGFAVMFVNGSGGTGTIYQREPPGDGRRSREARRSHRSYKPPT